MNWKTIAYYLLPLIALALFINKPYHIDDVVFLRMADLLPFHLLGDVAGTIEWNGQIYDLSPYESSHPPGTAYYLKWLGLLQPEGYAFWHYHLGFLLFPLLLLWAGRRFAHSLRLPAGWTWLVLFTPGMFVSATNLMTDAATAVFWTITILAAHAYARDNQIRSLMISLAGLAAALMCAYQSTALLGLIAVRLLMRGRLRRQDAWFLLPPLLFLIYLLSVYQITGFFPYLAHNADYNIGGLIDQGLREMQIQNKGFSIMVNLGFCLWFLAPLLFLDGRGKQVLLQLAGAFGIYWFIYMRLDGMGRFDRYAGLEVIVLKLFAFLGVFFMMHLAVIWSYALRHAFDRLRNGKPVRSPVALLGFWFFGVLFYNWTLMPFGSPRYLLPALTPAILMLAPQILDRRKWLPLLLVLAAAGSLFCARIDYEHAAGRYRVFEEVAAETTNPDMLWFNDEFGLNHYLNHIGAHYLPEAGLDAPLGAKILITRNPTKIGQRPGYELKQVIEIPSWHGFALYQPQHGAGFYCSYDGLLPINRAAYLERIYLFEVVAANPTQDAVEDEDRVP